MPFGAMISGLTNLFSGVAQRKHEKEQNEANLKAQKEENEINRQWQERMWEEHESPQAQVQNMKASGLNPVGNVGSQSVGSASTSSLPSAPPSQAPQFIARAGEAVANSLQAYRVMKLEQDKYYHQVRMDWKEDLYKQIELARTREELDSILEERKESIAAMREERRGKKINNDFQQSLYEDLEQARRFGYNRFVNEDRAADDAHDESNERLKSQKFINSINDEFGREFYRLDYEFRKEQVQEFLDNKDNRKALMDCAVAIQQNIKSVSDREEALDSLQSQYEREIAQRILDATKDGNAIDGVLLKYLTENPFATINVLSTLSNFTPTFNQNTYQRINLPYQN